MFIASAHAQSAGAAGAGGAEIFNIVFLVGLFVLFYFIAIRPQRKRQKEHSEMVSALSKGDEVVTSSGILGKISALGGLCHRPGYGPGGLLWPGGNGRWSRRLGWIALERWLWR